MVPDEAPLSEPFDALRAGEGSIWCANSACSRASWIDNSPSPFNPRSFEHALQPTRPIALGAPTQQRGLDRHD